MSSHTIQTLSAPRPYACPECGSGSTVQVIYGLPDVDLFDAADAGFVIFGGHLFEAEGPTRECRGCHAEWREVDGYPV
ncbi:hypothetical protein [Glaciibacter flavus]|uniref:hypothetical protein n=1 Tax=Orlajensenia flava TaxID=2565934 RepID=UPI003B00094B